MYAHSLPGESDFSKWETMSEHEQEVTLRCRDFLARLDPAFEPWGELLGRWHDIGKYSQAFQTYLTRSNAAENDVHRGELSGKVDHSTAAAQLVCEREPRFGRLLAYIFAGHHAGLPDWDVGSGLAGLKQRLEKQIEPWRCEATSGLSQLPIPPPPKFSPIRTADPTARIQIAAFRLQFWVRILFSALVDADFLATESFMNPEFASQRVVVRPSIHDLRGKFEQHLHVLQQHAAHSLVNEVRAEVSETCLRAAKWPAGLYSLNVPTGGGKTLASMRFALNHAAENGLDGVVVAIPFTSIIEQNAAIYRDIFTVLGDDIVLEHHSNLDPSQPAETTGSRLHAENWDAPIVVTTNVQLFESMFASRTSKARKLHRIARRVIILDEVQSLPVELLSPTLLAIQELVESYGCTVVLCTATQPALEWHDDFPIGLRDVTPIVKDVTSLHQRLERTRLHMIGQLTNSELAARIDSTKQSLCIVNTRADASDVFTRLNDRNDAWHLSTRMCAAHRWHVLETEIRPRLERQLDCRVISTQLIEAGVDVDFPVVFRAICGLDSLTQAAGRCNREGRREYGDVFLFEGERPPPPGMLRHEADSGKEVMGAFENLLSPEAVREYFQLHYWRRKDTWDKFGVLEAVGTSPNAMQFQFREMADRYRYIRDSMDTVIVPWGEGKEFITELENAIAPPHRDYWRKAQRYTVSLHDWEIRQLLAAGAVAKHHDVWVLTQSHLYDNRLGITPGAADGILPVDDMIC